MTAYSASLVSAASSEFVSYVDTENRNPCTKLNRRSWICTIALHSGFQDATWGLYNTVVRFSYRYWDNNQERFGYAKSFVRHLFFSVQEYPITVLPAERQALVEFYRKTHGDRWIKNERWMIGDPCLYQWYGVGCAWDLEANRPTVYSM